jgi:glycosyltransferase involved in cell wall biosynthesis
MRPRLTIICPAFNEEAALPLFFERTRAVTLAFVRSAAERFPGVYFATLSKNVGYQRAVECGLRIAKGDLFIVIDADCEDPPEMIPEFLACHAQGYDVVYGERVDRPEGEVMKALRRLFYRITRAVADDEVILDMAEFALITSEVRDAIAADASSFPFIRASIGRVGFRRAGIPYKRQARVAGRTHYNLLRMTTFAVAGILSASTLLLRLPIYLLPFWLLAVVVLTALYASGSQPWQMVTLVGLICGYLGATTAFIAIYVARIYKNTLGQPNYVIERRSSALQP